ncbi:MAG: glycosyl transferase group 1 [Verrucomicrobia bacterium]|nr:MAG: glycosyl transferase group 1 [Verrucomicrobiota bacterium]
MRSSLCAKAKSSPKQHEIDVTLRAQRLCLSDHRMKIFHLTPGAGTMYCGACLRDNALVAALRKLGHEVLMIPLYLPLTLDEVDETRQVPIFFGGINVYLDQKSSLFRNAPDWFHRLLSSPRLLKWAADRAARTHPEGLGELTYSMLQGESGNQKRELEELLVWLKTQPKPDVISLSDALLLGMARRLKSELNAPVICSLQGEDTFLDGLAEPWRGRCWEMLAERAADIALFVSPSRYFADKMRDRLRLPQERVRVVYNGINLEGYAEEIRSPKSEIRTQAEGRGWRVEGLANSTTGDLGNTQHATRNTLGFFARMSPVKGLDTLVEAYIHLRQRGRVGALKLRIGGSCTRADEEFVQHMKTRLAEAGLIADAEFCPNLDRDAKIAFLRSLTVMSVPARYGEAFGLYLIEAMAAGVPVVQPRSGAFPELIEATGGGVLCPPGDSLALAQVIEELLLDPARTRALGEAGRRAVTSQFTAESMAKAMVNIYDEVAGTIAK